MLTLLNRSLAQIVAVELEHIEGAKDNRMVVTPRSAKLLP
jgi:hypothetical protein